MWGIFLHLEGLKNERNAVIIAHKYQDPNIQDAAYLMGEGLAYSKQAKTTNVDIILFCNVHFMCETEKNLNPEKQVIFPDINAGCSLETMVPEISIPDNIRIRALKPLERMLALS